MKKILAGLLALFTALGASLALAGCDLELSSVSSTEKESNIENSNSESSSETVDETPRLDKTEAYLSLLEGGSFVQSERVSMLSAPSAVSYQSENPQVATVSQDGLIEAVGIGETVVTLSCEGVEPMQCKVEVASGMLKSKADLDFLANACKAGNKELWSADKYYALACDIDYAGETFTPIAPLTPFVFEGEWGVFGALNDGSSFEGTVDGKGRAIENAVIPFGTVLCEKWGAGGAFIGSLKGTLKNIAFKNCKTQSVAEFKEANPETPFTGVWDVNQMQGIVSHNAGLIDNVYAEIYLQTAGCGSGFTAGGLVALNDRMGTVRSCITKMSVSDTSVWDGGIVGRFWNGVNGEEGTFAPEDIDYLSDVGLIVGTNNGVMENCYAFVAQKGFKTTGSTEVYPYLPMFYGGFYAGWWFGPNYTGGMGRGSFTNLKRFENVADFLGVTSDSMFARAGFNIEMWYAWWNIVI